MDGQTVRQVWFPGDHCDVGGSHTTDGLDLSAAPLVWMVKEATAAGLKLADLLPQFTVLAADHKKLAVIPCHNSAKGFWRLAELLPTYSANDDDEGRFRRMNLAQGRFIPSSHGKALVHESVRERQEHGYDPKFLPKDRIELVS